MPENGPSLLILTAVDLEATRLARRLALSAVPSLPFRAFDRGAIRVAVVGPGARQLPERWPRLVEGLTRPLVVSAGVCGGLAPNLAVGDLVLPDRVIGPAGEVFDLGASSAARAIAAAMPSAWRGSLVTTWEVVGTVRGKAALRAETGAVAVDMESAGILAAAAAAGCPSVVVRAVSDVAGRALAADLVGLVAADGRLRLGRAVALALRRPASVPQALALGRDTGRALAAVSRALGALAAQRERLMNAPTVGSAQGCVVDE